MLVTAINLDLGGKIWWPSKLDRGEHAVDPGAAEPERESGHRLTSRALTAAWAGESHPAHARLA